MTKICFITTTSQTLRAFILDTARNLHERGTYDITFICAPDEAFARSLPPFIRFIPVPMQRGINLRDLAAICALKDIFQKERFDIVQYATPNASLYASIAARLARIPVRLYCQWGIRYVGFSGMARMVFKCLEKLVCNNSTTIRAVSPMNAAFATSEGLYTPDKVKVLGRGGTIGVDLKEYPLEQKSRWRHEVKTRLNLPSGFTFGFAGRLSRDKGGNELLGAFRKLQETQSGMNLLIVGPNEAEKDISPDLLHWAAQNPRVVFTGMVPKTDMPTYYAVMDALVHPTYREGFGMVLQEAAAMELPVLTTNIPGASEVLVPGESCLLCEAKDTHSLCEAMAQLMDRDLCSAMGAAARRWTEQHYERSAMLAQQFADYELMGSQRRP